MAKTETTENPSTEAIERSSGGGLDLKEVGEMLALGKQYNQRDLTDTFISEGKSVDALRQAILERMGKPEAVNSTIRTLDLDLNKREAKDYSLLRLLDAMCSEGKNQWQHAGFEREISQEIARQHGKEPNGAYIPLAMLMKRDLSVGTPVAGGNLVATNLLANEFITILRNQMVMMQAGVRMLTGLVGQVQIPRQFSAGIAGWIGEDVDAPQSEPSYDQIALTNRTVAIRGMITRKLLKQASLDVENLLRDDLMTAVALALDSAIINGSGTGGQPRGILQTSGIASVSHGTNGGPMTWANVVALETAVANANANIGSLAYLTNTRVRGAAKTTPKVAGQPVYLSNEDGTMNGNKVLVSNQVPNNFTKGTGTGLSGLIYGNFNDILVALWGALDIVTDPYTGASKGNVKINMFQDADVAIRRPQSFSAATDIST